MSETYATPEIDLSSRLAQLITAAEMPHVLVVDDDERLRSLLARFLSENGFLVTTAESAAAARAILSQLRYDLIVLDVMMPDEDGLALTRSMKTARDGGDKTPILLLTALGEIDARIQGFEAGADDYLAKPFEPRELLLRMSAILRRTGIQQAAGKASHHKIGPWRLDPHRGELVDEAQTPPARIMLTQVEHTLLSALLSRHGMTVSREELAGLCGIDAAERTIDVQVTRLRKKVEPDPKNPKYVQTVRGKGYVLWLE